MTAYYQQVLNGAYDNHVLPFLWMKGESQQTIAEYLEKNAGADIHEVCLESRPHPDFCTERGIRLQGAGRHLNQDLSGRRG